MSCRAEGKIIGGVNEPGVVMDNPLVDLVDLNGDGLPDILETGDRRRSLGLSQPGPGPNGAIDSMERSGGSRCSRRRGLDLQPRDLAQGQRIWPTWMATARPTSVSHVPDGDVFYFANRGHLGWGPP